MSATDRRCQILDDLNSVVAMANERHERLRVGGLVETEDTALLTSVLLGAILIRGVVEIAESIENVERAVRNREAR